jgi:hypothetical protein
MKRFLVEPFFLAALGSINAGRVEDGRGWVIEERLAVRRP